MPADAVLEMVPQASINTTGAAQQAQLHRNAT